MNYKLLFSSLVLCLLLSACVQETIVEENVAQSREVQLQVGLNAWDGPQVRAAGENLTPITLLLVENGGSEVLKHETFEDAEGLSLEIPHGSYEILAVCGLPEETIPDNLFQEITIPTSTSTLGSLTDFAVGSATITNEYGKLSQSSVSITAKRQLAWMTVKLNDVPAYFQTITLQVKDMQESYNIAEKWSASEEAKGMFTSFNMLKKAGKNYAALDAITKPCINKTGSTEFKIVVTTTEDKTLTYRYISNTPLIAGKHLTLNLSISDLALVSETITTEDWDESTENGTLTNPTVE